MPPVKVKLSFTHADTDYKAVYSSYSIDNALIYVVQVDNEQIKENYGDFLVYMYNRVSCDFLYPVGNDLSEINSIKVTIASAIAKNEELLIKTSGR